MLSDWLDRVDAASSDPAALAQVAEALADGGLPDDEREHVQGRIDDYLDGHNVLTAAKLHQQVDDSLTRPFRDDHIPDFEIAETGEVTIGET